MTTEIQNLWKTYLYTLQLQAPKPKLISCENKIIGKPNYYGIEFHGKLSRDNANILLTQHGEGSYLVRESERFPGTYTLCLRYGQVNRHYKLYFEDGRHYVRADKKVRSLRHLVADGLITMHVESRAGPYLRKELENRRARMAFYGCSNSHEENDNKNIGGIEIERQLDEINEEDHCNINPKRDLIEACSINQVTTANLHQNFIVDQLNNIGLPAKTLSDMVGGKDDAHSSLEDGIPHQNSLEASKHAPQAYYASANIIQDHKTKPAMSSNKPLSPIKVPIAFKNAQITQTFLPKTHVTSSPVTTHIEAFYVNMADISALEIHFSPKNSVKPLVSAQSLQKLNGNLNNNQSQPQTFVTNVSSQTKTHTVVMRSKSARPKPPLPPLNAFNSLHNYENSSNSLCNSLNSLKDNSNIISHSGSPSIHLSLLPNHGDSVKILAPTSNYLGKNNSQYNSVFANSLNSLRRYSKLCENPVYAASASFRISSPQKQNQNQINNIHNNNTYGTYIKRLSNASKCDSLIDSLHKTSFIKANNTLRHQKSALTSSTTAKHFFETLDPSSDSKTKQPSLVQAEITVLSGKPRKFNIKAKNTKDFTTTLEMIATNVANRNSVHPITVSPIRNDLHSDLDTPTQISASNKQCIGDLPPTVPSLSIRNNNNNAIAIANNLINNADNLSDNLIINTNTNRVRNSVNLFERASDQITAPSIKVEKGISKFGFNSGPSSSHNSYSKNIYESIRFNNQGNSPILIKKIPTRPEISLPIQNTTINEGASTDESYHTIEYSPCVRPSSIAKGGGVSKVSEYFSNKKSDPSPPKFVRKQPQPKTHSYVNVTIQNNNEIQISPSDQTNKIIHSPFNHSSVMSSSCIGTLPNYSSVTDFGSEEDSLNTSISNLDGVNNQINHTLNLLPPSLIYDPKSGEGIELNTFSEKDQIESNHNTNQILSNGKDRSTTSTPTSSFSEWSENEVDEDSAVADYVPITPKTHTFKVRTFKSLKWCDICGDFMWGLISQGVKCRECGIVAHSRCSKLITTCTSTVRPSDTTNNHNNTRAKFNIDGICNRNTSRYLRNRIFGVDLTAHIKTLRRRERRKTLLLQATSSNTKLLKSSSRAGPSSNSIKFKNDDNINSKADIIETTRAKKPLCPTKYPIVLVVCCKLIEKYGINCEGIYRIPGSAEEVDNLRQQFDNGLYNLEANRYEDIITPNRDINVIASTLKLYLRLLPIPLITFDCYDGFVDALKHGDNESGICNSLKDATARLPNAHYLTLKYLTFHLKKISDRKAKNLMGPANLATVFAPNILKNPDPAFDLCNINNNFNGSNHNYNINNNVIDSSNNLHNNTQPLINSPANKPPLQINDYYTMIKLESRVIELLIVHCKNVFISAKTLP